MGESGHVDGDTTTAIEDWCLDALKRHSDAGSELSGELSNLTVVVPSWQRQDYLLRQIRHWSASSASLVIVDGSRLPLPDRIRSSVEAHPRITYRHEHSSFPERVAIAAEMMETPYAVMLGDDEFFLRTGLSACIDVLEHDQDLVGCMGQVLSFSPVGPYRRVVFARDYASLHGYSIRHAAPADRLIAAMSEYKMATCYAVLRTPTWRKSWGTIGSWGSSPAHEVQQVMAVHLLGGLATTNHVQWLRSIENPSHYVSTEESDRYIYFPEWWESPRYATERSDFVGVLAEAVGGELGVGRDECSEWVRAGAEAFIEGHRELFQQELSPHEIAMRQNRLAGSFLRRIARLLPDPLFLSAKRLRGRALRALGRPGGNYYGTVDDLAGILESEEVILTPESAAELASIEVMVREFHELRSRE